MASANMAWEVWSRDPHERHVSDRDSFVAAFKDRGEARERMRRLKRSHPDVTYFVKRRKVPTHAQFGTRAHARRRGMKHR